METLKRFIHEDDGQNLVEYALLAGLVALVAITAIEDIGTEIDRVYTAIAGKLVTVSVAP